MKVKKTLSYENFFKDVPYKQAYDYHLIAVREGLDTDPVGKLREIKLVSFADICAFAEKWKT